jgi:predicted DNA-binding protein with PD1-like motif
MHYKLIAREPKTYVLIFETGDELALKLLEAHIRPTCELVLTESPAHLRKQVDPESGVALIKLPP